MRPDKVIERNYEGKFCFQPMKRLGKTKRLSTQMSIHHAPGEVGAFHKRCVDGITVGALQPRNETILVSQDQ